MCKIITASLLFFCLSTSVHSREEQTPRPPVDIESINIEEAVELALANSVEIRKTVVSIRDNETRLSEENVWNWLKPNLSLRGGFDIDSGQPRLGLGVGIDLKDIMGAGNKRIRTLNFSISEGRKSLSSIKAEIRIKVIAAYKEYYLSKEKLQGIEVALETDAALLKTAEETGPNMERLLARSMVNQDRVALVTAKQELIRAESNIRDLLGITSITEKQELDEAGASSRKLLEDKPLEK